MSEEVAVGVVSKINVSENGLNGDISNAPNAALSTIDQLGILCAMNSSSNGSLSSIGARAGIVSEIL